MNEITNNIRKRVKSLGTVKGRRSEGCFVVEGTKSVLDSLSRFDLRGLFATQRWLDNNRDIQVPDDLIYKASTADMERMTALSTPSDVLAVFSIPVYDEPTVRPGELYIALDGVADPGNLGTIVRMADWFGVEHIFAGQGTVDIFNPKTVMSTMGSIGRVRVHYVDLPDF